MTKSVYLDFILSSAKNEKRDRTTSDILEECDRIRYGGGGILFFLEKAEQYEIKPFVDKMTKLLPLLYLKAALLPDLVSASEDDMPQFVTEEEYEYEHGLLQEKIGRYDEYLEVFNSDMQYSDTPVVASISEDLTDMYQDLKDMVANFQRGFEYHE